MADAAKPRIAITYCSQCNWLLRAAWMGQELLQTFGQDIGEVALVPGTGGIFEIRIGDELIWERKRDGGFPEAKVLKQIVRDRARRRLSRGQGAEADRARPRLARARPRAFGPQAGRLDRPASCRTHKDDLAL